MIQDKHDGIVPDNFEDLIAFPGVGPKMAHLVL
jgi:endonuclease III